MINRRTLLLGTAGAVLSGLLASCQRAGASTLKVVLLEGSIPSEVLQKFKQQDATSVDFQAKAQLADIFQQLQQWQQADREKLETGAVKDTGLWGAIKRWLPWAKAAAAPADRLVSLGDYWLESAIAQNLIEPLNLPDESLAKLPLAWQQLGSRNAQGLVEGLAATATTSLDGQSGSQADPQKISLWAAPYKVQALVVVYRQSVFPQSEISSPFASWQDLLLPELKERIALPDHPRLVIGLAQKIQSGQFNAVLEGAKAGEISIDSALTQAMAQLNQQVKTYSSDNPLKALVNEDVSAVVCWSGDAIAAAKRYRDLRIAIPAEGSLLSADMWVRPKGAEMGAEMGSEMGSEMGTEMSAEAKRWIDFCWQAGPATQISVNGKGIAPIFLSADAKIPDSLKGELLSAEVMQKSELLLPIPAALKTAYFELWKTVRSS